MSTVAISAICRVGIQFDTYRIDFAIPADVAVSAVLPSIVDRLVVAAAGGSPHDAHQVPMDWQLFRCDGRPLTARLSLRDNGICDGDLLCLSQGRAAVAPPRDDVIAELASAVDRHPRWNATASVVTASFVIVSCTALVGCALLRSSDHQGRQGSTLLAVLLYASTFLAAVICGRAHRDTVSAPTLGSCAAAYAAVAGYLAVPGNAQAPKVMLAAVAGATVAALASRCTARGTTVFTAAAAFGYLSGSAACLQVFAGIGVGATGASLSAAAIAMLAVPARLAIWFGRLQAPALPTSGSVSEPGTAADPGRAHAICTGLVCGLSAAATAGTALAAFGGAAGGALLAAVVALVLLLRISTYVDLVQSSALMVCGCACFAAVFIRAVTVWPTRTSWFCLGAVTAATAAAMLLAAPPPAIRSPLLRRCIEVAEYAALAALIPLACWATGVFGAVRGLA